MSSPLSTLRKTRRAPLPGCESGGESRAYKETSYGGPAPSDAELISSMLQKLVQLERKVKAQALDLDGKARRIAVLEDKLTLLQGSKGKTQGEKQEEEAGLARMCQKLQNQVWEMEKFLNDYGMIWVGSGEQHESWDEMLPGCKCPDSSEHALRQPGTSLAEKLSMNFDLVLRNIQDLNILAGEGGSCVTSIPGGATLSQRRSVPLWLFRNGIMMFDGPFRSYQDPGTQQCMQDLMDGYFPSELQGRFPDGVVFQVHDRRGEEFPAVRQGAVFPGRGHAVGGSDEQLEVHKDEVRSALLDLGCSQLPGRKLSMQQFLNKLPENVVRAGKVINIRSSLKAHLQGSVDGAETHSVVVETPMLQALRESLKSSKADRSTPETEVTTLRMKSEDGEKTFILKMRFSETIGHIRQYLDGYRGTGCSSYDIITAFPQRCYSDDTETLLACGLTPNAVLLLRPRPQATSLDSTT